MKTMKDFAAQRLTKKQMNDVKGGDNNTRYPIDDCGTLYLATWGDNTTYVCSNDTKAMEELDKVGASYTEVPF